MIIGICCVDNNWGLGRTNKETGKGELLFKLRKDMEFFQDITKKAGIVVFGENTYLSLPKRPLKDRVNVVLCQEGHEYEGCLCFHSFDKLLNFVQVMAKRFDVCICGGGMMYKSMLPYCDEVIVNKVKAIDPETTVFFPNMDEKKDFVVSKIDEVQIDNGYETQFYVYERKPVEVPIKTPKLKLTTAMHITEENLDLFEEALRR